MLLLTLSPELIEKILYELPSRDLVGCMRLNKFTYSTIRGSIRLMYKLTLMYFGAEDNVFSTLTTRTKLQSLEDSQRAWTALNPALMYVILFEFPLAFGSVLSLSEGMLYGFGSRWGDVEVVNMIQLVTAKDPEPNPPINRLIYHPSWMRYGSGTRTWLTYTTSLYEYGLLAEVHSEWEGDARSATTFKISIYLRQYENPRGPSVAGGSHHIYVMDSPVQRPFISIQMVGRHIVIIIGFPEDNEDNGQDNIFVYDFLSDALLIAFRAPRRTYRSITFLDEHYILFPNIQEGCLDIFRIPLESTFEPIAPLISLDLPILQTRFSYQTILVEANPKPMSEHSYAEMDRRFRQGPKDTLRYTLHPERAHFKHAEDSLCVFTVRVETAPDSRNTPTRIVEEFTFVVHRSALLEIVAEYDERPSPAIRLRPPPHTRPDYHGPPMHEPLTSRMQLDSETGHIRKEEESGDAFWSMPRGRYPLSWENWGPGITRWFNDINLTPGDITRGWGNRCVRLAPGQYSQQISPPHPAHPDGVPYVVLDFFRSNRKMKPLPKPPVRFWDRPSAPVVCGKVAHPEYGYVLRCWAEVVDFTQPGRMDAMELPTFLINRVFLHPVISALPYYYRASVERVKWGRALIDDQMIVGLLSTCKYHAAVQVRYFG